MHIKSLSITYFQKHYNASYEDLTKDNKYPNLENIIMTLCDENKIRDFSVYFENEKGLYTFEEDYDATKNYQKILLNFFIDDKEITLRLKKS